MKQTGKNKIRQKYIQSKTPIEDRLTSNNFIFSSSYKLKKGIVKKGGEKIKLA